MGERIIEFRSCCAAFLVIQMAFWKVTYFLGLLLFFTGNKLHSFRVFSSFINTMEEGSIEESNFRYFPCQHHVRLIFWTLYWMYSSEFRILNFAHLYHSGHSIFVFSSFPEMAIMQALCLMGFLHMLNAEE